MLNVYIHELLHTTFDAFRLYAGRRDGVSLRPVVRGPGYTSRSYGDVAFIDTSAILGYGRLYVFLVNRSLDEAAPVTVKFSGGQLGSLASAEILTGTDPHAGNTYQQPNCLRSRPFREVALRNGQATLNVPPLSVTALTFSVALQGD